MVIQERDWLRPAAAGRASIRTLFPCALFRVAWPKDPVPGAWLTYSCSKSSPLRANLHGRRVSVDVAGHVTEGMAEDIGVHGELIVDGKPFVAGSITHL